MLHRSVGYVLTKLAGRPTASGRACRVSEGRSFKVRDRAAPSRGSADRRIAAAHGCTGRKTECRLGGAHRELARRQPLAAFAGGLIRAYTLRQLEAKSISLAKRGVSSRCPHLSVKSIGNFRHLSRRCADQPL